MYVLLHAWCSDYTWPKFKFTAQKGTLRPHSITPNHFRDINQARLEPQTTVNSFCMLLEMKMIAWCWAPGHIWVFGCFNSIKSNSFSGDFIPVLFCVILGSLKVTFIVLSTVITSVGWKEPRLKTAISFRSFFSTLGSAWCDAISLLWSSQVHTFSCEHRSPTHVPYKPVYEKDIEKKAGFRGGWRKLRACFKENN